MTLFFQHPQFAVPGAIVLSILTATIIGLMVNRDPKRLTNRQRNAVRLTIPALAIGGAFMPIFYFGMFTFIIGTVVCTPGLITRTTRTS
jgi:ABC-type proline/glycine betaine transport system permease subunit